GNNHDWEGANVTSCDGSLEWYPYRDLVRVDRGMVPPDHYVQHPNYDHGNAPTVYWPMDSGLVIKGQHHMDEYWIPNRQLYGYRTSGYLFPEGGY
ncbi:MAG: hypothetical protein KGZ25_08430, partial [Planctomycetes bacterium]|nr:hypothetical protein [Planctomycetota bacterium]